MPRQVFPPGQVNSFFFFWPFMALLTGKLEDMTGKRGRERGSDMQQRDPGWESNPGPLQSPGTGGAHCTD